MQGDKATLGKKALPVWIMIAGMVVIGSYSIGFSDITGNGTKTLLVDDKLAPQVIQTTKASGFISDEPAQFSENIDVNPEVQPIQDDPMSFVATGTPVVFSPGQKPEFIKKPDASGISIQSNTRVVLNYISDIGETVVVAFKLDNLSEANSLVRIKVSSSDRLLVDIVESGDVKVVRPTAHNEYLIEVDGSAKSANLIANITAVGIGFHPFNIEILPL
jgi:hypothetical protein